MEPIPPYKTHAGYTLDADRIFFRPAPSHIGVVLSAHSDINAENRVVRNTEQLLAAGWCTILLCAGILVPVTCFDLLLSDWWEVLRLLSTPWFLGYLFAANCICWLFLLGQKHQYQNTYVGTWGWAQFILQKRWLREQIQETILLFQDVKNVYIDVCIDVCIEKHVDPLQELERYLWQKIPPESQTPESHTDYVEYTVDASQKERMRYTSPYYFMKAAYQAWLQYSKQEDLQKKNKQTDLREISLYKAALPTSIHFEIYDIAQKDQKKPPALSTQYAKDKAEDEAQISYDSQ